LFQFDCRYAYVNPVVALLFGNWFGNEALSMRTMLGAALILVSFVIVARDSGAH